MADQLQGEAEATPAISPGRKIRVCLKREKNASLEKRYQNFDKKIDC